MTDQPSLTRLIARLVSLIDAATGALEADPARVDDWYDEVARQLRRYTLAAWLSGGGQADDQGDQVVSEQVKGQLAYLKAFRDEIKAAGEWSNTWSPRAQMYAQSIKAAYWNAKTLGWPLPDVPGSGTTQCKVNCGCAWEIDELEGDGNADAYWRRAKDDSCQTCIEREQQWSPLQIRGGVVL